MLWCIEAFINEKSVNISPGCSKYNLVPWILEIINGP